MWPSPAGEVSNTFLPMRAIVSPALKKQGDAVGALLVDHAFAVESAPAVVSLSAERSLSDIPLFQPARTRAYRDERFDPLRHQGRPEILRGEIVSSPSSPNGNDL
jgi:hypothetical protein